MSIEKSKRPVGPVQKRRGAYLPHWTAQGAIYFVTFRLDDSLPHAVVESYREERKRLLESFIERASLGRGASASDLPCTLTVGDHIRLRELFSEKIEKYLDAGKGRCWMYRPEIADIVENAILHFDNGRYTVHAWSVMPNHVHVVVEPYDSFELSSIMHSWKSFTAKECNRKLGRRGVFWQAEYYDHLVRGDGDYQHCIKYTQENPLKGGLKNWKWVGVASASG